MSDTTGKMLASRAFYEQLNHQLSEAGIEHADHYPEVEVRIVARVAADHLASATETRCPESMLQAIRDVAWVNLDPITRLRCTALDAFLNSIIINPLMKVMSIDGRWISRIGAHGRVLLDNNLLLELQWEEGDSLLLVKDGTDQLSIRKVVRLKNNSNKGAYYSISRMHLSV